MNTFPPPSRWLPAAMRPHVAALYAFARVADDMADEGDMPAAERQVRLRRWSERLHAAFDDPARALQDGTGEGPMLAAAAHSIRHLDLPIGLFDDLVSAFSQDTFVTRYDTWGDVLDYC